MNTPWSNNRSQSSRRTCRKSAKRRRVSLKGTAIAGHLHWSTAPRQLANLGFVGFERAVGARLSPAWRVLSPIISLLCVNSLPVLILFCVHANFTQPIVVQVDSLRNWSGNRQFSLFSAYYQGESGRSPLLLSLDPAEFASPLALGQYGGPCYRAISAGRTRATCHDRRDRWDRKHGLKWLTQYVM